MSKIVKRSLEEKYGEDFVTMTKETAIKIIREHSEYENKERVVQRITQSVRAPYNFVPPAAYERFRKGKN